MSTNRVKIILIASLSLLGLVASASVLWYVHQNRSGHTGFHPYLLLIAYIPLAVVGATDLVLSTQYKLSWWSGALARGGTIRDRPAGLPGREQYPSALRGMDPAGDALRK